MTAAKGGGCPVRTGILGGSFNPVHLGHVALARHIVERRLADEVWLMVSPCNPLKSPADLAPETERLHMARLAVEDVPGVEASDFEFSLPRPSYTAHTLRKLGEAFPQRRFSLIIGADNWDKFHLWREPRFILLHYPLIVYPRAGQPGKNAQLETAGAAGIFHVGGPEFPYSSTQVRQALRSGESGLSEMLSPGVLDYIRRKRLYEQK